MALLVRIDGPWDPDQKALRILIIFVWLLNWHPGVIWVLGEKGNLSAVEWQR